ncbi:hypothetical protein GGR56DRAFT_686097 [Xylariaceae sp. FL0804]|nr:hypothetical protein GGR56DRAFT_686097 [Xylariaceae sp. FL0804]
MGWTCGTCWREFAFLNSRHQHMVALGHHQPPFECDTCERYFGSAQAVDQHMNACNHFYWECRVCEETWPTEEDRRDHEIDDHEHWECDDCGDAFCSEEDLCIHQVEDHGYHECAVCFKAFESDEDRRAHEVDDHCYCSPCGRSFQNNNNIKMHLNSAVHRGRSIQCPFCRAPFASATGLGHHLESGACPRAPGFDRDAVHKLVRSKDPGGLVTKKLLKGAGGEGSSGAPRYEATELAWNGQVYECYLCHRDFAKLESLNQHLASSAHEAVRYHCPNRAGCGREFTTLAGLMNHLESESCGYTRFENVQRGVKNIISGDKRITFR